MSRKARKKVFNRGELELAIEIDWHDLHRPRDYAMSEDEKQAIYDNLIRRQERYKRRYGHYYPLE